MGKIETREYHVRILIGAHAVESAPAADLQRARTLQEDAKARGHQAQIVRTKKIIEVVN